MDPHKELLWRQYAQHVDLYKFYVDATVKLFALHYAITGAILSYYFAQPTDSLVRWALVLPAVMSTGLAVVFWLGAKLLSVTRQDMFDIRDGLSLEVAPEFSVLGWILRLFAILLGLTGMAAIGLIVLR